MEKNLIEWVLDWNEGESSTEVNADTDLLASGLLDSMGLVGIVTYLEEQAGSEFDFSTFDPSESASVRSLIRHCLSA
jgi:acyl carrier protein